VVRGLELGRGGGGRKDHLDFWRLAWLMKTGKVGD